MGGKLIADAIGMNYHTVRFYAKDHGAPLHSVPAFTAWMQNFISQKKQKSEQLRRARWVRQREAIASNPMRKAHLLDIRRKWYARQPPVHRLKKALIRRVYKACTTAGAMKAGKTFELIGCDAAALRRHLELQFTRGMDWSNYGTAWHVDHIIPCSHFDLSKPEHQKICFNWQNLRPLWASENVRRQDKIEQPTQIAIPLNA